jgi:hypothetical protein
VSRFHFTDDTLKWCFIALNDLSSHFESVTAQDTSSSGCPTYNLMADAIEWTDERPEKLLSNGTLKQLYLALLNARTSLILNDDPHGLCQKLLDYAAIAIPKWSGLRLERRNPTLGADFRMLQSSATSEVEQVLKGL